MPTLHITINAVVEKYTFDLLLITAINEFNI